MRLSPEWEVTGGMYDLENNPFWVEIIDNFLDPDVFEISVIKSTRVGGTLTLIAVLLSLTEACPAPSMVITPDESSCIEIRDRIYATALNSPRFADKVPRQRKWNTREIDLQTMRAYMAWSGSAQRLRGKACRFLFRTEVDVYQIKGARGGDPMRASSERVGRFFESTIYNESTPDGDPSVIDSCYERGDQRKWNCSCPHCGAYQELRFFVFKDGPHTGNGGIVGHLQEDGRSFWSMDRIRSESHYRCINGCEIGNHEKLAFVKNGIWVPEGQSVIDGKLSGISEKNRRHVSYHLWKIHIPTVTFGELACGYAEHYQDAKLKDFWQNWLGRRYRAGKRLPTWRQLGYRLQGEYDRGTVPKDSYFLTAGIDVQEDEVYWVVWAWGDRASAWLVDWGMIRRFKEVEQDAEVARQELGEDESTGSAGELASDLKRLRDELTERPFKVYGGEKNGFGKPYASSRMTGIDTNYRSRQVHHFVMSFENANDPEEDRVRCVRGDHKVKPADRFRMTTVEKPRRGGEAYEGGMQLWGIYTIHYKDEFANRFQMDREAAGVVRFPRNMVNIGEDFLRQFANEKRIDEPDKRNRKNQIWVVINDRIGNHYSDASCYAFACAEMLLSRLELTWDASTWLPRPGVSIPDQGVVVDTVQARMVV